MVIIYYFLGCIPMIIIYGLLYILIDKLHLMEKIQKFDDSNSGPVYDTLKAFFFIIIILLAVASLGVILLPIYVYYEFINGNIINALLLSVIASIVLLIDSMVFNP